MAEVLKEKEGKGGGEERGGGRKGSEDAIELLQGAKLVK